jgi:hypothetical protein
MWDVEAWLYEFVTLALDIICQFHAWRILPPGKLPPPPPGSGNWVCPGAGLDALEWEKYLDPARIGTTNPDKYVA